MKSSINILFVVFAGVFFVLFPLSVHAKRPLQDIDNLSQGVVVGLNTSQKVCRDLQQEQLEIGSKISTLSVSLHTATKSAAKKISKEIDLLTDQLVIVERKLAMFPVGVVDPSSAPTESGDDAEFRRSLDSIAAIRVGQSDPFAGRLSEDAELDRMYRDYLRDNRGALSQVDISISSDSDSDVLGDDSFGESGSTLDHSQGRVYRVMIAISRTKLSFGSFSSLDNVIEQRMPSGGYVYYQGSYVSQRDAQVACNKILAAHQFRDAFVVAMEGGRRVPL
ncbi:MAG: hypothetical protein RR980_06905 [Mucinivorans sp.]